MPTVRFPAVSVSLTSHRVRAATPCTSTRPRRPPACPPSPSAGRTSSARGGSGSASAWGSPWPSARRWWSGVAVADGVGVGRGGRRRRRRRRRRRLRLAVRHQVAGSVDGHAGVVRGAGDRSHAARGVDRHRSAPTRAVIGQRAVRPVNRHAERRRRARDVESPPDALRRAPLAAAADHRPADVVHANAKARCRARDRRQREVVDLHRRAPSRAVEGHHAAQVVGGDAVRRTRAGDGEGARMPPIAAGALHVPSRSVRKASS